MSKGSVFYYGALLPLSQLSDMVDDNDQIMVIVGGDALAGDMARYWAYLMDQKGGDPRSARLARTFAQSFDANPQQDIVPFMGGEPEDAQTVQVADQEEIRPGRSEGEESGRGSGGAGSNLPGDPPADRRGSRRNVRKSGKRSGSDQ